MTHWRKEKADNPCCLLATDYRLCVYVSAANSCLFELDLFYFPVDFEHTNRNL